MLRWLALACDHFELLQTSSQVSFNLRRLASCLNNTKHKSMKVFGIKIKHGWSQCCFESKQHRLTAKAAKPNRLRPNRKKEMVKLRNTQVNRGSKERVFETPFQWTIRRNVSSKKRQTIYSESAELVTTCAVKGHVNHFFVWYLWKFGIHSFKYKSIIKIIFSFWTDLIAIF